MSWNTLCTSAAVFALLYTRGVEGHAYQSIPKSRTVKHNGGPLGQGDLQSFNKGGPCGLNGGMLEGTQFGATVPGAAETFTAGSTFDIEIVTTAHHKGWYEFRLCRPADGGVNTQVPVTQECLNQHVLQFDEAFTKSQYLNAMPAGISSPADYAHVPSTVKMFGHPGSCINNGGVCSSESDNKDRWVLPEAGKVPGNTYQLKYKLPADVTCDRCILQWHWQTGNSPFSFPEGFWGCTDIKILASGPTEPPTSFPTSFPTTASPTLQQPTPTKAPTPVVTGDPNCVRLVDFVPETFCQQPNACIDFPTECGVIGQATRSPTTGSSNTCHSLVSHIPDSWCQGVKCDPVYFEFCSTGTPATTSAPTLPGTPITRSPTKSPTEIPDTCLTTDIHTSAAITGDKTKLDAVTRVQVDVNVAFAEVETEYQVGEGWQVSLTATRVPFGNTVAVLFDQNDGFSGNSFAVEIQSIGNSPANPACKTTITALITVPEGTAWEENLATLRTSGYANEDGTSGFYVFLPSENPGNGGTGGDEVGAFNCGGCNGCLWVEFNACYQDWDSNTCADYYDLGYRFCTAGLVSGGPEDKSDNNVIYAVVAVAGVALVVGMTVLFVKRRAPSAKGAERVSASLRKSAAKNSVRTSANKMGQNFPMSQQGGNGMQHYMPPTANPNYSL